MYFVTGGSFNGKRKWVNDSFLHNNPEYTWFSFFDGDVETIETTAATVVLEGLEYAIRSSLHLPAEDIREKFKHRMSSLLQWEQDVQGRKVIWIGSEIGKGIVPVDAADRKWRDVTGWIYQDLADMAQEVWVVWYGIGTPIKR
ncbi:bifunctional adenosylcobinamide kinase/adenosylcobinamide-phosphate guanylyltransferase [Bacillus sp. KH172YL63]|uniref:bifunctional adenosylcobinamide kinase/adenosylcobinamide-phosphate guanylyltransferase n=1 Tax=Bacillus sp. KH172YL63 TaxID=2709784 RepID=UPI0013E504C9|nr:bifunctional adenosylcobinamide kinase/adenosylcobinamide-phosphate guanylyltransferase [Bacillus sp. KH172YL63]BCB03892.1 hypothetical protein KH172YL63_20250 [Bacillus sp. KH172YL63]